MIEKVVLGFVLISVGVVCLTAFMILRGWLTDQFNNKESPELAEPKGNRGGVTRPSPLKHLEMSHPKPVVSYSIMPDGLSANNLPDWNQKRHEAVSETIRKSEELSGKERLALINETRNQTAELAHQDFEFKFALSEILQPSFGSRGSIEY